MNVRAFALSAALLFSPLAYTQATAGTGTPPTPFKDTSLLKPPAGHPVALMELEDLGCPACAHAAPIVHTAIEHYKIPYMRYDFPLAAHIWTRDAAITARYLQDKVSPEAADTFRKDMFANQMSIGSKDDLAAFTQRWFATHKLQQPFVMDPSGRFAAEVQADYTFGERIGLIHTPTIVVVTNKGWIEVLDVTQLYSAIDTAIAQTKSAPQTATAVRSNLRKPKTPQR